MSLTREWRPWEDSANRPVVPPSEKEVVATTVNSNLERPSQPQTQRVERGFREGDGCLGDAGCRGTLFDAMLEMVFLLNPRRQIVQANTAAAAAVGCSQRRLVGQHCYRVMHGTEEPVQGCPFDMAVQSGRRAEGEFHDRRRGVWIRVTVDPVLDAQGDPGGFLHTVKEVTEQMRNELALQEAHRKIRQLTARLEGQSGQLRTQVPTDRARSRIIGQSPMLLKVLEDVERVAKTNSTVLITGETGTGKELIATAIHEASGRSGRPMHRVNCAALAPTLIESELFGREKGAYTGALTKQMGRFEMAHLSTLLLDEVGELPLELQGKLLRVLEEGTFERLGDPETVHVDVRIIAASNRDLDRATREGKIRADLFYRLNVFAIHAPPLRERPEDIPALVWMLIDEFNKAMGKTVESVPEAEIEALQHYPWPGNVRELRNVVERAMILCDGPVLRVELPASSRGPAPFHATLAEMERDHILRVLEETKWRIRGEDGAAGRLGMKPTTLESRLARMGIRREAACGLERS